MELYIETEEPLRKNLQKGEPHHPDTTFWQIEEIPSTPVTTEHSYTVNEQFWDIEVEPLN